MQHFTAPDTSESRDVAILQSGTFQFHMKTIFKDSRGCYIFVNGIVDDKKVILASMHQTKDKCNF